jgi:neutral ceramidase
VRFLKVNDTLIWSAPVELFCEISIAVRNQSPFAHTFYFGYANGWLGYLPTKAAFEEGGYEPKTSPFTERAEADLLASVLTYVQGIPRR